MLMVVLLVDGGSVNWWCRALMGVDVSVDLPDSVDVSVDLPDRKT